MKVRYHALKSCILRNSRYVSHVCLNKTSFTKIILLKIDSCENLTFVHAENNEPNILQHAFKMLKLFLNAFLISLYLLC